LQLNVRWNISSILIAATVLLIYGVAVFLATRHYYRQEPVAAGTSSNVVQSTSRNIPHDIPKGLSTGGAVLMAGSERITAQDAQRLVATASPGKMWDSNADSQTSPEELSRIADAHFRQGLFQEAAAEYARVLEQAAHNIDVYNNLGLTLHYIDRSREAVEYLEKGIAIDAGHQRIWLTLGFVQSGMGDVGAARLALARAVALDPESRVGREAKRLLDALPE
jgi:tetratricopeptide (TPR) repeat protein